MENLFVSKRNSVLFHKELFDLFNCMNVCYRQPLSYSSIDSLFSPTNKMNPSSYYDTHTIFNSFTHFLLSVTLLVPRLARSGFSESFTPSSSSPSWSAVRAPLFCSTCLLPLSVPEKVMISVPSSSCEENMTHTRVNTKKLNQFKVYASTAHN